MIDPNIDVAGITRRFLARQAANPPAPNPVINGGGGGGGPDETSLTWKQRSMCLRLGAAWPLPESFPSRDMMNHFISVKQAEAAIFASANGGKKPLGGAWLNSRLLLFRAPLL